MDASICALYLLVSCKFLFNPLFFLGKLLFWFSVSMTLLPEPLLVITFQTQRVDNKHRYSSNSQNLLLLSPPAKIVLFFQMSPHHNTFACYLPLGWFLLASSSVDPYPKYNSSLIMWRVLVDFYTVQNFDKG